MTSPNEPIRLLFLIGDTGGGHRSAATGVAQALDHAFPGYFDAFICDPLRGPGARCWLRWLTGLYGPTIRISPWLWGVLWRMCGSPRFLGWLRRTLMSPIYRSVAKAVATWRPAVIVSFHPLTAEPAVRVRDLSVAMPPVITVITDLVTAHLSWRDAAVDRVIVPSAAIAGRCAQDGMPEGHYVETGLPVGPEFSQPPASAPERQALQRSLGLGGRFLVVVTGGGEGSGGLYRRTVAILRKVEDVDVAVICGRNQRLRRRLTRLVEGAGERLTVHGFVDNMAAWLRCADIVVGKAGPGTIAEATRDTSPAERERRIGEVIGELSLTAHADTRTSSLSGGQQKRVNVALELLTKPSLLFLDEPTSGLDPGLDMSVMEMMSGLAREGRTVIVVTHSVANLDVCDRLLVLVPDGRVAYFGSPADGLRHFRQPGWAQVFRAFEAEPDRDWAREYRHSEFFARYMAQPALAGHASAAAVSGAPPPPKSQNRLHQLSTLIRRYVAVIASDRNYVGVIALLPIILGGLIRAIPDPGGLTGTSNGNAIQVLLILVMGACLIGVANAVRELVKERSIYTRERAAGLSPGAYLWSKLVILGLISAVQAVILVLIGLAGRPLPKQGAFLTAAPLVELMLGIAMLAIASMTAGLLISAVVNSSDKTMPLLVVAVLAEVVLSGGVFRLNGKAGLEQLAWFSPSRWGFGAVASTTNLNQVTPPPPGNTPDPLWQHSPHVWLLDMGMQLVLTAVLAGLTWWRLYQARPGRRH